MDSSSPLLIALHSFIGLPDYEEWNDIVFPDPIELPNEEEFNLQAEAPVQAEPQAGAMGPPPLLPGQQVVEQPLPPAQQYVAQAEPQDEAQAGNPEDQAIEVVHI